MGWVEHPVIRSFDALRFMRVLDHGIVWRGAAATYPPLAPSFHIKAARIVLLRFALFDGDVSRFSTIQGSKTFEVALGQSRKGKVLSLRRLDVLIGGLFSNSDITFFVSMTR